MNDVSMFKTIDSLDVKNENRSKIENKGNLDAENEFPFWKGTTVSKLTLSNFTCQKALKNIAFSVAHFLFSLKVKSHERFYLTVTLFSRILLLKPIILRRNLVA